MSLACLSLAVPMIDAWRMDALHSLLSLLLRQFVTNCRADERVICFDGRLGAAATSAVAVVVAAAETGDRRLSRGQRNQSNGKLSLSLVFVN